MTHPTHLVLERFSVEDLPTPKAREVEDHIAACETCTRYLDELGGARSARLRAVPAAAFVEKVATRRGASTGRVFRIGGAAMATLAMAAALLLFLRRPAPPPEDGVRLKGSSVTIQRSRGGDVRVLSEHDKIRAGDALRIVVSHPRSQRVGAWFVDAHGRVDRVVEGGAFEAPSGESALPGSVVVEAPCIDLELVVLFGVGSVEDIERTVADAGPGALTRRLRCE